MARIIFIVWPMAASVLSGLKIARDLRSRGHEVSYLGLADCRKFVDPHGFPFTPLYADWLPETPTAPDMEGWSFRKRLQEARARVRAVRTLLEALASDQNREFQDLLASEKPDLLVIHSSDFEVIIPSLLAFEVGIKSVYLYDTFARAEDFHLPPLRTAIVPKDGWLSSVRTWLAWKNLKIKRRVAQTIAKYYGLDRMGSLYRASRRIADRCRYPWEFVGSTDLVQLKARLPELIICPRQLEFPNAERPGRHYLGCNIDIERQQPEFPWDLLDSRPLIYCALGTLNLYGRDLYRRFFQVVLDVAAAKPTFQWVVCLYDSIDPEDFANIPANVILVKRAPQLALLQRSKIAIVHGGSNTVKECAYFGVPMVVFPMGDFDPPGNTARVVYHGLGVRGEFRSVTPSQMSALVERVEKDSYIQIQARLMGETLRADNNQTATDFVESLLVA